jgi:DNA helicase-2/ATP-dependent DNA helicase PcrA
MLALAGEPAKASEKARKAANITVVGDDDQSIYKFRGAAISNILQFKQVYPSAKRVVLTENYRSRQGILDAAYKLIENNNPYRLEISESVSKKLTQARKFDGNGNPVNVIFSKSSSGEADRVVKEIAELTKKKYTYSDIAILVRAHTHSDDFVQALRYAGIPYKFGGARGLYNRSEIMILISFLRVLADSGNEVSMFNLLSMQELGLQPREVVELLKFSKRMKISTLEVVEGVVGRKAGMDESEVRKVSYQPSNKALTGLNLLVEIFDKGYRMMKDGRSVGEILFMFFEKSKYKDRVLEEESVENQIRVDNIRKYFDMVKEYERNNLKTTIYEYLGYLDYSLEIGENPSVDQSMLVDYDAVNIMTVHSAKGLEFPVVFLVNLVSERFPSRNISDKIPIPDKLVKEVVTAETDYDQHLQEERRLFYVGATRAEERLYLSAAGFYSEGKRRKRPSIFLNELLDRDIRKEFEDLKEDEAVSFPVHRGSDLDIVDMKSLGIKPVTRFSYSQLSTYERCPREYKYRYVLGLPTPVSAAASFGITVHSALKAYYEKIKAAKEGLEGFIEMPTKKELLTLYDSYWISQGYDDKLHEKKRYEYGRKRLEEYLENFDTLNENPLELEKRFNYAIEDVVVTGVIDRIDLVENGKTKKVEILDYKTGKAKTSKEATKEWQLALYALAAEEQFGFSAPAGAYIYLDQNRKIPVEITEDMKRSVKKKVVSIARKIREGDFTVPSGHICNYCSFGDIGEEAIL